MHGKHHSGAFHSGACSHPAPPNLTPPFALTRGLALLPASQIISVRRSSENNLRDDTGMGMSPIPNPDLHYGSGREKVSDIKAAMQPALLAVPQSRVENQDNFILFTDGTMSVA